MKPGGRCCVILVGQLDPRIFTDFGLLVIPYNSSSVEYEYGKSKALVIAESPENFGRFGGYLRTIVRRAEQHGLHTYVIANSAQEQLRLADIQLVESSAAQHNFNIKRRLIEELPLVAKEIALGHISPILSIDTKIEVVGDTLNDSEEILLRRAFYDSSRIFVQKLSTTPFSRGVYCVHASIDHAPASLPLPYFVKFLSIDDFGKEWDNYHYYIEPLVPFNLRPNLNRKRCAKGNPLCIIVANMVEDALPLREALRAGAAFGCIFSLFESTLRRMRQQPFANPGSTSFLSAFVRRRASIKIFRQPDKQDVVRAARRLGLRRSPEELEEILCGIADEIPYLFGPSHNDLHCGNVLFCRGGAILIDFGSVKPGPITSDPAALEVSLVFGTVGHESSGFSDWKSFVSDFYGHPFKLNTPTPDFELKPSPFKWLYNALGELRHILLGCRCHSAEVPIVLATYLLRFARLPLEVPQPKRSNNIVLKKHAFALVIAERIIESMEFPVQAPQMVKV